MIAFSRAPWPILAALALHVAVAIGCAAALALAPHARPILGLHPAVKPLKFAVSIAILLASIAWVLAILDLDVRTKDALAWVLALTMIVEMVAIGVQALRGTTSHYNVGTSGDAMLWRTMGLAIVAALLALVTIAGFATVRGLACSPLVALGLRLGLWLVLLSAISGFAMAGAARHSVGGFDGGSGLPIANWSSTHGDLRVSHFFALHGLQALPITAALLARVPVLGDSARRALVIGVAVLWLAITIATLAQALVGRPLRA